MGKTPLRVEEQPIYEADSDQHVGLFPYSLFKPIVTPKDVYDAVRDETLTLENEFGSTAVEPFYDLLWPLNSAPRIMTSHIAVANREARPPFDWARTYVATQISIINRDRQRREMKEVAVAMARQLTELVRREPPDFDVTGCIVIARPCGIKLLDDGDPNNPGLDKQGYTCDLAIGAAAANRSTAAMRWKRTVAFVTVAFRKRIVPPDPESSDGNASHVINPVFRSIDPQHPTWKRSNLIPFLFVSVL